MSGFGAVRGPTLDPFRRYPCTSLIVKESAQLFVTELVDGDEVFPFEAVESSE